MRTLSGRQPYWYSITHLSKRIENRTRCLMTKPGPILLHASANRDRTYFRGELQRIVNSGVARAEDFPDFESFERGGIVGRAVVKGFIRPHAVAVAEAWAAAIPGLDLRWWDREQYGFVLADVERLPFVPCAGALWLFEMDDPFGTVPA